MMEPSPPAPEPPPAKALKSAKPMWIPDASTILAFAALIVAIVSSFFFIMSWLDKRNADLVQIGVSVLRVDPEKEKQTSAAREWALRLIDANAGGVTFSDEERKQLLREPLKYDYTDSGVVWGGNSGSATTQR